MTSFMYKSGIGTSSRSVEIKKKIYLLGVLVQANFGKRDQLVISGVPVGRLLGDPLPKLNFEPKKEGSLLAAIATDAPLLAHQLKRLTKRVAMGLAKVGGTANDSSGDIFVAFSTQVPRQKGRLQVFESIPNEDIDPLFEATIFATEEAIVNSLASAATMVGINGNEIQALSMERVRALVSAARRVP